MITLNVHSSLAAVGFLARITTALAKAGIGVNPVSGFHHDHLFVPDGRERDAMAVLAQVSAGK
nr:ACT domain-containing protein [Pacificimonas pallii]